MSSRALRAIRLKEIALVPQGAMSSLNPVMRIDDQMADAILAHSPRMSRRGARPRGSPSCSPRSGSIREVAGKYPARALRRHEAARGDGDRDVAAPQGHRRRRADQRPRRGGAAPGDADARPAAGRVSARRSCSSATTWASIAQFADTVGVMYAGRLVEIGPVEDVISAPRHPYTRLLIDSLPRLDGKKTLAGIPGLPPRADRPAAGLQLPAALSLRLRPLPRRDAGAERGRPAAARRLPPLSGACRRCRPMPAPARRPRDVEAAAVTALIELRGVTKDSAAASAAPPSRSTTSRFSLSDAAPSTTAIAGESGSGKTTLARMILGFVKPTSGQVFYRGQDLATMSDARAAPASAARCSRSSRTRSTSSTRSTGSTTC